MDFLDRILRALDQQELTRLRDWIASRQSRDPAPDDENILRSWLPIFRGADEALQCLFLASFLFPWQSWELVERIAQQAYLQEYNGRWEQVQEVLEQVSTFENLELMVQLCFSEDDFFGNFLGNCEKMLRREKKSFKSLERDRHRPRRLIRRRGPQDKGSIRPSTLKGSFPPDPNPGIDRRRKVHFQNIPDF